MLFSYNWLNDYLAYNVSPQELGRLLTVHAFETTSLTRKSDDWVLDIDVLPNRAPDCFSHQGIAREANAILGFYSYERKPKDLHSPISPPSLTQLKEIFKNFPKGDVAIEIENTDECERYDLVAIEGMKVSESLPRLKKRLEVVGIQSINNLVDISNYVMLDTGQPIHIFDAKKIEGSIRIRRAHKGESLHVLRGGLVQLGLEDLVIADDKKVLALAGIKGGENSGVSEKTSTIFIESAHFNRERIYQSAKRLNLVTDSAKRFGAGLPFEFTLLGLHRTITLIQDTASGRVSGYMFGGKPESAQKPHLFITQEHVNRLLGVSMSDEVTKKVCYHLGFNLQKETNASFKVHFPYWRQDMNIPEDLIEEVGRLYGFNEIKSKVPETSLIEPADDERLKWRSFARRYFIGQGFDEVYNHSLTSSVNCQLSTVKCQPVGLLNPISERRKYLRQSLIPGLLEAVALNQGHFKEMKIFEIGKVLSTCQMSNVTSERSEGAAKADCQVPLHEREMISGAVFVSKGGEVAREIRGYVESFFEACGFDHEDYEIKEKPAYPSIANILMGGETVGMIEIPRMASRLKIKGVVGAFELDGDALMKNMQYEREFEELPRYPAIERDISLYLPRTITSDKVIQIIHEVGKELIEDVDLFDVFQESTKKELSLAFHIIYRSKEKTLTDKEVGEVHKKIEQALIKRLHAKVR